MSRYEILSAGIPPEPPVGSCVLDKGLKVWQSYENNGKTWWIRAVEDRDINYRQGVPWGMLLFQEGDLTLIYRAGEQE